MGQPRPQAGVTLDAFTGRYAARTAGMTASEIRALFAVASRPEVVSLAGGMPYTTALPLDAVGKLLSDLLATKGAAALQYGSGQGDPQLRELICDVMRLEGVEASPDDVVVTVGSQQALDLVTRIFCDPGDVVLAEAPSYVGALGTFAAYQARGPPRADGRARPGAGRPARARRRRRRPGQVPLHDPQLPQPGRHLAVRRPARRGPRDLPGGRDPRARGQPVRPARLRRPARSARSGRAAAATTSSTSARSPRPSRPACGSAGCSRRTPSARSSCWPPRRACCARRR